MKKIIKNLLARLHVLNMIRKFNPFYIKYAFNNKKKQNMVLTIRNSFSPQVFIETGTYLGDMIDAVKGHFKKIYSIELSNKLYENAIKRFKNQQHITLLNGDSSIILPKLLTTIQEPALFWLDAHYSSGVTTKGNLETPIIRELETVFAHPIKNHIVMIDDARLFTGKGDYPTLEAVRSIVTRYGNHEMVIDNDIIQLLPRR